MYWNMENIERDFEWMSVLWPIGEW
jgi:hypothetical protein